MAGRTTSALGKLKRRNLVELRKEIAIGLDQARRGEVIDGKTAIATIRTNLQRRHR